MTDAQAEVCDAAVGVCGAGGIKLGPSRSVSDQQPTCDAFRSGPAEAIPTQPFVPCFRLGVISLSKKRAWEPNRILQQEGYIYTHRGQLPSQENYEAGRGLGTVLLSGPAALSKLLLLLP